MDRSLDEILAERQQNKRGSSRGNRGGAGRRRERQDFPRDGVRKSFREDAPRNLDSEWVHDRFEDEGGRRSGAPRRRPSPDQPSEPRGSKVRVENVHYELTEEDLEGLFKRIGPIVKLELRYDRAGRSEGTAFVTYESHQDATRAVKEYDGANAAGQPIRLTILPSGPGQSGPGPRRNPFDTAVMPGRPLSERISQPSNRTRSLSPQRQRDLDDEDAARKGIDRYRPGSRSPMPARRRDGGRRPGARREGGRGGGGGEKNGGGAGGGRGGRDGRPKKTQEELDAEMENYFGGGSGGGGNAEAGSGKNGPAQQVASEDVDMIE